MGFSLRKRTKGKTSWLNGSIFRRGRHASLTSRLSKAVTLNTSGRGIRGTINFGNGLRYIATRSIRRQNEEATPEYVPMTDEQYSYYKSYVAKRVIIFVVVLAALFLYSWLTH